MKKYLLWEKLLTRKKNVPIILLLKDKKCEMKEEIIITCDQGPTDQRYLASQGFIAHSLLTVGRVNPLHILDCTFGSALEL